MYKWLRLIKRVLGIQPSYRDRARQFQEQLADSLRFHGRTADTHAVDLALRVSYILENSSMSREDRLEKCWQEITTTSARALLNQLNSYSH